jgi:flavorubredoxin
VSYNYDRRVVAVQKRPIHEIAKEIVQDWKNVYFGARPYLDAMMDLDKATDSYGQDPATSIIAYFLSNARGWKGDKAKTIKKELQDMIKR